MTKRHQEPTAADEPTFEQRIARIETSLDRIEQSGDAAAREAARDTVATLLELHRAALGKILGIVAECGNAGRLALENCLADDLVRSVLLLHDLHPESLESRVQQALDTVRPYLNSHGGGVELIAVSTAVVRLKMQGACNGCPSSSATQRDRIEQAIHEIAPDAPLIEFDEVTDSRPIDSGANGGFVELKPRYVGDPPAMTNVLET